MNKKFQKISIVAIISLVALGFLTTSASAEASQEITNENYKELLKSTDQIIKRIRLGREISDNEISNLAEEAGMIFPDSSISEEINALQGSSETEVDQVKNIRIDMTEQAKKEGLELPFTHKYALFILLGISFSLSIVVNVINRVTVDWEEMNRVKERQSEIQDELKKAREENDMKKANKLEQKQQEFMQEHMGVMFSPLKSMIFIFIPFIIVFNIMSSMYSGWIVAWLPFKFPWPDIGFPLLSRFFKGSMTGLGFFGWYILSYFGFAQIMRKILIPNR